MNAATVHIPHASASLWCPEHSRRARAEGWDIRPSINGGVPEIQCWRADFRTGWHRRSKVIAHVAVMAIFGNSAHHRLALLIEYHAYEKWYRQPMLLDLQSGKPINLHTKVATYKGDIGVLVDARPPSGPDQMGRVFLQMLGASYVHEMTPNVIGARWCDGTEAV